MKQMRAAAKKDPPLVDAVQDCMEAVKILISDIICHLRLKGRHFEVFFQQLVSWKLKMYGTFFIQLTCSTLNLGDIVKNIIITPFA